jgi:hypothetical protein
MATHDGDGRRRANRKDTVMSSWIEIVIGKLLTDHEFRARFLRDPHRAIQTLMPPDSRPTHADTASIAELVNPFQQFHTANRVHAADARSDG